MTDYGSTDTREVDQTSALLTESGDVSKTQRKSDSKKVIIAVVVSLIVLAIILTIVGVEENWTGGNNNKKNFEKIILNEPNTITINESYKGLSELPHIAGSHQQIVTAGYVSEFLEDLGYSVYNKSYNVYLPQWHSSSIDIIDENNTVLWSASLTEIVIEEDPYSDTIYNNRSFLGWTPSGNVKGDIIYVNYGRNSDFEMLVNNNYTFSGKICMARYGSIGRSSKLWFAQLYNCSGLIIYNDPFDDGYNRGVTFPEGPWRPKWSYQRGSCWFSGTYCAGSPDPERLNKVCPGITLDNVTSNIPAIPMAWGDAINILERLTGSEVYSGWSGSLNITYHIGGNSDVRVHLVSNNSISNATLYNVYGVYEADTKRRQYLNESIMIGHHRDAWVMGSCDDISGGVAVLETAASLMKAIKKGWKPKRDIIIASWDGEELGLLGSIAHVDDELNEMQLSKLAIYVNVDVGVAGPDISAGSNPLLSDFMLSVMKEVDAPKVYENNDTINTWYDLYTIDTPNRSPGLPGSGSDYAPFQHRKGIPTFYANFDGAQGQYHSVYDDITYIKIVDPHFYYSISLSQFKSVLMYKLLDNDILPFNLTSFSEWLDVNFITMENDVLEKFDCDITGVNSSNVSISYSEVISTLDELQIQLENVTNEIIRLNGVKNDNKEYYDSVRLLNNALLNFPRYLISNDGIGTQQYYSNMLWQGDPINLDGTLRFPQIFIAARNDCNEDELTNALDNLSNSYKLINCELGIVTNTNFDYC